MHGRRTSTNTSPPFAFNMELAFDGGCAFQARSCHVFCDRKKFRKAKNRVRNRSQRFFWSVRPAHTLTITGSKMDDGDFQYEYFVNCSMSRCEVQDYFFASGVGTCNLTTQLCECPTGYSGADMWSIWNDCHINIQQRDALEFALLALAILSFSSS